MILKLALAAALRIIAVGWGVEEPDAAPVEVADGFR